MPQLRVGKAVENQVDAPLKVLIVDDEPDLRDVLEDAFVLKGCEVESARNGREALGKFASGVYDLLVTDLNMPEMDGRTLLEQIHERFDDRPYLVAISGLGETKGEKHLVDTYLLKPFGIREVEGVIEKARESLKADIM